MKKVNRRQFLKTTAVAAGVLAASDALAFEFLKPVSDPLGSYPYRGWEGFYKEQWDFDHFGRTAHSVNCTGNCTWRGFVKNGIMYKEEQFADYPFINDQIPTYNPRGCQKGANHKEYVYGPQRVKYPLIHTGERGEGRFRRASWDEALSMIAEQVVETIDTPGYDSKYSPDQVTFFAAIPAKHHLTLAGGFRLANLVGGVVCSFYDWYCDLPPGQPLTWGVQTDACESADWFNSKFIMVMGANLLETRIPDSHYFSEARYNGCKTVVVAPEYNPVATRADVFVPIKPGTDAALCLGMARYVIYEGLYDAAYIKQFTDMPLLVREDTGKFLRKSDDPTQVADYNTYYYWNGSAAMEITSTFGNGPTTLPTLVDAVLEPGDISVNDTAVTTVFARLKEKLVDYTPSYVEGETAVAADDVIQFAKDFANTKPARIIEGAGTNHYYHNDLINRAQILILALTGNVGKPGAGFDHYVGQEKLWAEEGFFHLAFPHGRPRQRFQNTTLWTYVHAETKSDIDNWLPRPAEDYISEAVEKGWMPLWPKGALDKKGRDPKVLFVWGANYLNQGKDYQNMVNVLWPKLDLIVDINFRMDTTAKYADVVLPAASMFEKWDLNTTDLTTFMIPFTPVVDPQFESRTDWQIWRGLAEALAATGFKFDDATPGGTVTRDFSQLLDDFDGFNTGGTNVADDRTACQFLLDHSPETNGMDIMANPYRFEKASDLDALPTNSIIKHPQRFLSTPHWTTDIMSGESYYAFQKMFKNKEKLGTQTGRQQFYIDHDWYLREDLAPKGGTEELPIYKPPIDADAFPLRWITPHGRWSIHSTWRDAKYQLRLQRGRPVVYLSPTEAEMRRLKDNDLVTIFNRHGSVNAHLFISPRLPDGMAMMYHGWERYTLNDGWQSPCNIRIKPTQMIGMRQNGTAYGHINFRLNYWGPTGNQKDTRVEIRFKSRGI